MKNAAVCAVSCYFDIDKTPALWHINTVGRPGRSDIWRGARATASCLPKSIIMGPVDGPAIPLVDSAGRFHSGV